MDTHKINEENSLEIFERNKNELNVLKYNYMSWKYPSAWIPNIKNFFRNIKWAYQRVIKGYADCDCWNLDNFYSQLFYHTLKQLARDTHGWPSNWSLEDKTFEDWQKYLSDIADHFENTQEWNEKIPINQEVLKAWEEMNIYEGAIDFVEEKNSSYYTMQVTYKDEEKYKEAQKKWLELENKAEEFRKEELLIAMDMLKENFFDLWD